MSKFSRATVVNLRSRSFHYHNHHFPLLVTPTFRGRRKSCIEYIFRIRVVGHVAVRSSTEEKVNRIYETANNDGRKFELKIVLKMNVQRLSPWIYNKCRL